MKDILKKRKCGELAEKKALAYLEKNGLTHIASNYSFGNGEIDLIMQEKDVIVFVEVRARYKISHGTALESIDENKQQRLLRTAIRFLQFRDWLDRVKCRYDVVGVRDYRSDNPLFEWTKDAFSTDNFY